MKAHDTWPLLQSLIGTDGEYLQTGHLKLARSPRDLERLAAYAAWASAYGLNLELLEGPAFQRRFPDFGTAVIGGSFSAMDGQANPRLVAPAFARAAAACGARILENRTITGMEKGSALFRVTLAGGEVLEAPHLVNATGAGGGAIAAAFGEDVPLKPGYPTIGVTEPCRLMLSVCLGIEGGGFYARQVARGNVIIGGGFGEGDGDFRSRPGRDAISSAAQVALQVLPELKHVNVIRYWSGTEGYFADKNGILGPSKTTPGLVHAFGFSGGGFQISPAVGEVIAELVRFGKSTIPLDGFAVDRFSKQTTEQ